MQNEQELQHDKIHPTLLSVLLLFLEYTLVWLLSEVLDWSRENVTSGE